MSTDTAPEVRLAGLRKSFGDLEVLRGIDLEVAKGQVVCVIGPSGSGKSTLLRCINLLEQPSAGTVSVGGAELTDPDCDLDRERRRIGMVFQQFNLFGHLSVLDNVALPQRRVLGTDRATAERVARDNLARVGLADKADAWPDELSGGQQQRVAIARVMIGLPDLIIADEPTSALDRVSGRIVVDQLKDLAMRAKCAVVLSTHDERIFDVATRRLHIEDGRCFEVPIHYH